MSTVFPPLVPLPIPVVLVPVFPDPVPLPVLLFSVPVLLPPLEELPTPLSVLPPDVFVLFSVLLTKFIFLLPPPP